MEQQTQLPSIKQMLNRANSGHIAAMLRIQENGSIDRPSDSFNEIRGFRVCARTLKHWNCIDGNSVTARGVELLSAYQSRRQLAA